jgi:hypothetical protein
MACKGSAGGSVGIHNYLPLKKGVVGSMAWAGPGRRLLTRSGMRHLLAQPAATTVIRCRL